MNNMSELTTNMCLWWMDKQTWFKYSENFILLCGQTVIPFDNLSKKQMPLLKRRSNWELKREEMQTQSSGPRGIPVIKCVIFLKRIDSFYCLSVHYTCEWKNVYFQLFSILLLLFPFPRCQEHLNFIIFFCLISILRSRKRYFIEFAVSY